MALTGTQTLFWEMPFFSMCPWFHRKGNDGLFELGLIIRVVQGVLSLLQPKGPPTPFTHLLCVYLFSLVAGTF